MKGRSFAVAGLVTAFVAGSVLTEPCGARDGQGAATAAKERIEAAKAKREEAREKREEAKAKREEVRKDLEEKGKERIDKRQDNQSKRIEHGTKKGYLTQDEVSKLQAQQTAIANLEASALTDGKLTRDEFKSIRTELNEASRCIWAEKHDTDGKQMPTYRLGKNVFAKAELTGKLADENLKPEEARALLKDFHRTVELKRKLSTDDLSDAERAALQAEYNDLLNKYFEVR